MIRKTYGEVKQSKPAEVHNEPVETLEEIGLDATALETLAAALTGILGLPAVAVLAQKVQDSVNKGKGKEAVGLEEEYEATDHDIQIGPAMAGMVNIRKYLERSAPEYLNDLKAIDSVLTAYDNKMAYGDGDDLGVPGDNALGLEETIKRADAIIAESKVSAHDEVNAAARPGMIRVAIANKMNKKHLNTGGLTKEEKEKVEEKYDEMSKEDKDAHVKYFKSKIQPKLKPQTKK